MVPCLMQGAGYCARCARHSALRKYPPRHHPAPCTLHPAQHPAPSHPAPSTRRRFLLCYRSPRFSCPPSRRIRRFAMKRSGTILRFLAVSVSLALGVATLRADDPKPKRINRAIELLDAGQPIYYTGSHEGTDGNFEQGVKDAQTYADYISYDMEHAPFDVKGLSDYMKGLVKGGPTKSGHKTPAVIVNEIGRASCRERE